RGDRVNPFRHCMTPVMAPTGRYEPTYGVSVRHRSRSADLDDQSIDMDERSFVLTPLLTRYRISQPGDQRARLVLARLRTGGSGWTTSRAKSSSRLLWLQSAQSSSPSTRSASFGRRDGSGTVAMANITCR